MPGPAASENAIVAYHFTWWKPTGTHEVSDESFKSERQGDSIKKFLLEHCKKFVFQCEQSAQPETRAKPHHGLHYQGQLVLKKKMRLSQFSAFLSSNGMRGVHVSATSAGDGFNYCLKEDTRVAGPWADKPIGDYLKKMAASQYEYKGEDLPKELRGWQKRLDDYLAGPVNDREIIWIHDPLGSTGKSKFVKYECFHRDAKSFIWSDARHMLHAVASSVPPSSIYLFDLSRTKPEEFSTSDLYAAIECIKNGSVVSSMYTSPTLFFKPPHVVVFANHEPDYEALTGDRWNVMTLGARDRDIILGPNNSPARRPRLVNVSEPAPVARPVARVPVQAMDEVIDEFFGL